MSTGLKRKRRVTYTEETLTKAVQDVKSGAALNVISRKYKIPRTTLHSRVVNKHGSRHGTKPALSDEDEANLAKWVERICAFGCPIHRNQIYDSVVLTLKAANKTNPFVNGRPGKNWFIGFVRRQRLHEKIKENRRRSLKGIGVDGMVKWFAKFDDRLKKEGLHTFARTRMYNIDEVSFPLELKNTPWCLKEGPSVLLAGNAAGRLVPPMIVFDSKDSKASQKRNLKLRRGWLVQESEDAEIGSELFYNYIKDHFYPWLVKNEVQLPIVLFLCQQFATYTTNVLYDFCDKRKIILTVLPTVPHRATTPISINLLPVLKKQYSRMLRLFTEKKRVAIIGRQAFVKRLEEAFVCINIEENLEKGFYQCGLYPISAERYIKACIQLRPEEQVSYMQQNEEDTSEKSAVIDPSLVLKCIESHLDPTTVESFKSAEEDCEWSGNVADANLFHLWKKIKNSVRSSDQLSEDELENDESMEDESTGVSMSDSENENQENKGPANYTSDPKSHAAGGKHLPLSFIDDNLSSENIDRNVSIIVVNPNTCKFDSDEA